MEQSLFINNAAHLNPGELGSNENLLGYTALLSANKHMSPLTERALGKNLDMGMQLGIGYVSEAMSKLALSPPQRAMLHSKGIGI